MKLIAIDPGITKTGIVYGEIDNFDLKIERIDVINRQATRWATSTKVCNVIGSIIYRTKETYKIAIEEPIVFHGGGNKVIYQGVFLGALLEYFSRYENMCDQEDTDGSIESIHLVRPSTAKLALTGKGNSKKDQMVAIAEINYPEIRWQDFSKSTKETIADAIGIGLAVTKKLNGVYRLE